MSFTVLPFGAEPVNQGNFTVENVRKLVEALQTTTQNADGNQESQEAKETEIGTCPALTSENQQQMQAVAIAVVAAAAAAAGSDPKTYLQPPAEAVQVQQKCARKIAAA